MSEFQVKQNDNINIAADFDRSLHSEEGVMSNEIQPCREKWAGTLTDRERFNRQMHYESIDRCFNMEFGYWEENFEQWDIFKNNGVANNAEAASDQKDCPGASVRGCPANCQRF